jgi:hypothetical protein
LGWIIGTGLILAGFLVGVGVTLLALRARLRRSAVAPPLARPKPVESGTVAPDEGREPHSGHLITLIEQALRAPLSRLRRSEGRPPEVVEALERLAWQARMLTAPARPMQAHPTSPISLLEAAAQEVELLRLGKVPASWTLRNRQPVQLDGERAGAAFRELLWAAAEGAGEAGRIAIRILPGDDSRYPVRVEVEIGRRGAEPDPLPLLVARRLLEGQGAQVKAEGPLISVALRAAVREPEEEDTAQG